MPGLIRDIETCKVCLAVQMLRESHTLNYLTTVFYSPTVFVCFELYSEHCIRRTAIRSPEPIR